MDPLDFSQYNFVRTEQVQHFDASGTLQSFDVKETYDSRESAMLITGATLIVVLSFAVVIWFIAKRSKSITESFEN